MERGMEMMWRFKKRGGIERGGRKAEGSNCMSEKKEYRRRK